MYKIKEDIMKAIENSTVKIEELDLKKSDEIREKIIQLYCEKNHVDFLRDDLLEYSCISNPNAWKLIKNWLKINVCFFLINLMISQCF